MAQPEITFRHGACSASVFNNEVKRGDDTFRTRSVSFQRRYRDPAGSWHTSHSLAPTDIPKAVLVLNKAFEYITSAARPAA